MKNDEVTITVELTAAQALELAQFLKRVGLDDYKGLAADTDEAYTMLDAGEKICTVLVEAGYAPR